MRDHFNHFKLIKNSNTRIIAAYFEGAINSESKLKVA